MIGVCKLCGSNLSGEKKPGSFLRSDYKCDKCNQYSVVQLPNGQIESETLRSGNFYIVFAPSYKTAWISSTEEAEHKVLRTLEMEEFTETDAEYWNKKLKTYVLFQ